MHVVLFMFLLIESLNYANDINLITDEIANIFRMSAHKHRPSKPRQSPKRKPWLGSKCKREGNRYHRAKKYHHDNKITHSKHC